MGHILWEPLIFEILGFICSLIYGMAPKRNFSLYSSILGYTVCIVAYGSGVTFENFHPLSY